MEELKVEEVRKETKKKSVLQEKEQMGFSLANGVNQIVECQSNKNN